MKKGRKAIKLFIAAAIFAAGLYGLYIFSNPYYHWHIGSPFKTQEIIYRHTQNKNLTIEFQMQDSGALGYNRRIVLVNNGWLFRTATPIDTSKIKRAEWIEVNEQVNDLQLKFP